MYVYALKLQEGKYYIGTHRSDEEPTVASLMNDDHVNHSNWLETYPPIHLQEIRKDCEIYDDVKCMLQYMNIYGVENVRGSMLPNVDLIDPETDFLRRLVYSPAGKCHTCGASDHFVDACGYNVWNQLQRSCFICKSTFHSMEQCPLRAPTVSPHIPSFSTPQASSPLQRRKSYASMIFDKLYDLIFDRSASASASSFDDDDNHSETTSSSVHAPPYPSEVEWVYNDDDIDDLATIDRRDYQPTPIE